MKSLKARAEKEEEEEVEFTTLSLLAIQPYETLLVESAQASFRNFKLGKR